MVDTGRYTRAIICQPQNLLSPDVQMSGRYFSANTIKKNFEGIYYYVIIIIKNKSGLPDQIFITNSFIHFNKGDT